MFTVLHLKNLKEIWSVLYVQSVCQQVTQYVPISLELVNTKMVIALKQLLAKSVGGLYETWPIQMPTNVICGTIKMIRNKINVRRDLQGLYFIRQRQTSLKVNNLKSWENVKIKREKPEVKPQKPEMKAWKKESNRLRQSGSILQTTDCLA